MVLWALSPREQCDRCQSAAALAAPPQLCWHSCLVSYAANQMGMQMWLKYTWVKNKFSAGSLKTLSQGGKKVAQPCTWARRAIKQINALQIRYRFPCETHAASQGAKKVVML